MHTQGLQAAPAHEAFGSFLDAKHSAPNTKSAAKALYDLVDTLGHSYLSTDSDACKAAVAELLGAEVHGQARELMHECALPC